MAVNQPVETVVDESHVDDLQPGTQLLHGQYTITSFLNNGGFGITYLAKDSLNRTVVIKECFADAFCRRTKTIVKARSRAHQGELKSIIRQFIREAQSLSKLKHPNIVGVHQVFEDNDTAYMAIDFVDGRDLQDILEDPNTKLSPDQIVTITRKLLSAIGYVHKNELLHRDISPDNILLKKNGEPVLIDFGAAREHTGEDGRKHSVMRVVKDGYSPQEFYIAGSEQGPWSDLYALAASLYHVIRGQAPVNGQERLVAIAEQRPDPYEPLAKTLRGYPPGFLEAIDKALHTKPAERLQSAAEWLNMLEGPSNPAAPPNLDRSNLVEELPEVKKRSPVLAISVLAVAAVLWVGGYLYVSGTSKDTPESSESAAAETMKSATKQAPAKIQTEPAPTALSASAPQTAKVPAPTTPQPAPVPVDGQAITFALWDVSIPFEYQETSIRNARLVLVTQMKPGTDPATVGDWIMPGTEIYAVNDQPFTVDISFATRLLNAMTIDPDGYIRVSVRYKDIETKHFERGLLSVPAIRRTGMNSGLQFEARMQDDIWRTTVSQAATDGSAELRVGDVVLRETTTGTVLESPDAVTSILRELTDADAKTAQFDILRNGAPLTLELTLAEPG